MARGRKSLATWIHEALSDPDKVDDHGIVLPCTTLMLAHMLGSTPVEVTTVKVAHTTKTIAEMERVFLDKAHTYAQDLAGTQTFNVLAYYGGSIEPGARMIFTVTPDSAGENGLMTESPTPTGQIQQGMRQSDMAFMQMFRHQTISNEILVGFADRQSRHVERLESENRETFLLLKTIIMDQVNERHERDKELLKMERHTKLIEQLMKHGPIVANMIAGREIFPQPATDTTLFESIADSITPDRLAKLMDALGDQPHLVALMMTRFEQYQKQKAAAEAAAQQRTLRGPVDGEADAAGGMR